MSEEKTEKPHQKMIEVTAQKMDARPVLSLGKCGGGLHLKLPPELVNMYALETRDEVLIQFKRVRYHNIREVPKI